MGTISSTMVIAAAGFLNGKGLAVSPAMISSIGDYASSGLSSGLQSVFTNSNIANVSPTLANSIQSLPNFVSGLTSTGGNLMADISSQASSIIPGGAAGMRQFASFMGQAGGFGAASFQWLGAIKEFDGKSFGDFGVGFNDHLAMLSGGVTSALGQLKSQASGLLGGLPSPVSTLDLQNLGNAMKRMGAAIDPSNLSTMFDPSSFITKLRNQGLGDVGGINDKLAEMGITDLGKATAAQLRQVLNSVSGSDLNKIISQTGMTVPTNGSVANLGDMLDPAKVLPPDIQKLIPGGSFAGLSNAMTNIGGSFKDMSSLGSYLNGIELPELPRLAALGVPIPASISAELAPYLGSGNGPFGNPMIQDIIGTASGHVHTGAINGMINAQNIIAQSPEGQNIVSLTAALNAAALANDAPTIASLSSQLEANITALTSSTSDAITGAITNGVAQFEKSVTQLATEASNLVTAGMDLAQSIPGRVNGVLNMASRLQTMGMDKMQLGFNDMLKNMATPDVYGDAVIAALTEGRNFGRQSLAGITNTVMSDPMALAKKLISSA